MTECRGYKSERVAENFSKERYGLCHFTLFYIQYVTCFFVCLGLKSGWKKYLSSVSGKLANLSAVTRNFSAGEMSRVWVNDLYCFIQIPMGVLEGKNDCRIWSS